jgi:hypothetical protein
MISGTELWQDEDLLAELSLTESCHSYVLNTDIERIAGTNNEMEKFSNFECHHNAMINHNFNDY